MARPKLLERKIANHSEEQMRMALREINGGESIRKVAKNTKIPFTTLRRYYLKLKNNTLQHLTPNYEVNKVFTVEQENELKRYFLYCSSIFYGLTTKECRQIAFQMASKNNLKMPESWKKNCMAGKDWLKLFRSRHPELSLRTPEPCSMARATAFNQTNVKTFYDNLEDLLKRSLHFKDGTRIFNLDETATTTVQKPHKVIAKKGNRGVGKGTSGEKGTLVTTCCIVSASGTALPPVLVFPRKNFKDHMLKNTPPGTLGLAAPSGWMNTELFIEVMKHFIKHSNSSKENPSILVMDNHESHISVEALNLAKESGVHVLTLHPHTSGKLQPLDVGIYGPFKTYYNGCMDSWMLHHPGKQVTIYDVGEIIGSAFMKAMTPSNITNAFKKCGIFPFDRNLFTEEDFMPSTVTDRPCTDCEQRNIEAIRTQVLHENIASASNAAQNDGDQDNLAIENAEPAPSSSLQNAEVSLSERQDTSHEPVDMDVNASPQSPSLLQNDEQRLDARQENESINSTLLEANEVITPSISTPVVSLNNQLGAENVALAIGEDVEKGNAIETRAASSVPEDQAENTREQIQTFISPFQFMHSIKAGPRQNKRKPRKLGRSMIATDTPEKLMIEEEKSAKKRKKVAKKKGVTKQILHSDTDDEEIQYEEDDEYDLNDEFEADDLIITEDDLNLPLLRQPKEEDYVLVEFATKKQRIYYVGKVIENRNDDLEYYVSFLRKKNPDKFYIPNAPDLSYVKEDDIKLILPKPKASGSTSRQQSYYYFSIDLSGLNVH